MVTKEHPTKRWEVSIINFQENGVERYKVTRRLPEMSVAETRVFSDKSKAEQQFQEWLTE